MKFPAKYKTLILLLIPVVAFAQSPTQIDRQSFVSLTDSLAYELGKAYQMGKNCKKELSSIAPPKAAGLFINYMKENEVQQTMNNYESGSRSKSGTLCEREELKAFGSALRTRMAYYIKIATPFMRPYTER